MKNLTKEQIERINEEYDSIIEEGWNGMEIIRKLEKMRNCVENNVEFIENEEETIENVSLEDKIEGIWQYYDCAGLELETEEDLFRYLGI